MVSGSFKPEANTTEAMVIALPRECNNFIFQKANQDVNYGVRCWLGGSRIEGMWDFITTTNAAGTAITSVNSTAYTGNISIDGNLVTLQPGKITYPGNLVPETYHYIAW